MVVVIGALRWRDEEVEDAADNATGRGRKKKGGNGWGGTKTVDDFQVALS